MSTPDRSRRTNWSGNLTYAARELVRPGSVAELQEVVAAAAAAGDRVRALGSRHSFSSVADTDGVHVSTPTSACPSRWRATTVLLPSCPAR